MSNASGGSIVVRIEGKDVSLSDVIARVDQRIQQSTGNIRQYAQVFDVLSPKVAKDEAEQLRFAQSVATVAQKVGDSNGAIRVLAETLAQIHPNTTAANGALAQLQDLLNKQEQATEGAAANWQKLASAIFTFRSVATFVSGAIREINEVIEAGNALEKAETTFRVLSGSADKYQHNLQVAKEQQALFGGSLDDTLEGMTEFANLSNRTGIEIDKLTHLSRALATVDPAQGFKGAGIALKEFFSGNVTSLSRRFEIPKEVLNDINKLTDNKAKFEALADALAQFGINEQLVTEQTKTVAVSFDKLKGSAEDAKATLGQLIGELAQPFVESFTAQVQQSVNGLRDLQFLFHQTAAGAEINQAVFRKTDGFDAYKAKINELNAALPFYAQSVQALTPQQYAFAQSLIASGDSAGQAFDKVNAFAPVLNNITNSLGLLVSVGEASTSEVEAFGQAALIAGVQSAEGAQFVQSVTQAILDHNITMAQGTLAIQQFAAAHQPLAEAITNVTDRYQDLNKGIEEEIVKVLEDNNAKEVAKIQTAGIAAVLAALTNGTISQANAESILASRYNATAAQLPQLIALTRELAVAQGAQREAQFQIDKASVPRGELTDTRNEVTQDAIDQRKRVADATAKHSAEVRKALQDEAIATGTAAEARKVYNDRLREATLNYGANSVEAIKARTSLEQFEAAQAKAAKAGGGGKAPKLSANEKLNTALLDQQDKFNNKFEDAEEKHWDKVADIYDKFSKKQEAQFAQNEVSKRRSRADFYAGLTDASGIDTGKFAASYEEAFQKAQEIAQSGKAKLAQDFLDLRTKQIEEMQKLDQEAADIRADQKEGKISKKDAEAQLEFLEGRKKLIEDAQKEEQDLLLKQGDANVNALNEELAAEDEAYSAAQDKIATTAGRAAEAKIKHAQRSKIAVDEENRSLAQQEATYRRIGKLTGDKTPGAPITPTPPTTNNNGTSPPKVDVSATTPIPVSAADVISVSQADLFIVHDEDAINAIGDLASRLEGKLDSVVTAINDAKASITGAVSAVEGAVGRIRVNQPSVVQG